MIATATQRSLPLEISARSVLITLESVRIARGCDAESVLDCVGVATHPRFLRWVFDLSARANSKIRELRFWKDEVICPDDKQVYKFADPRVMIANIVPARELFPRGEIEVQWTINATTISRLVRAGELQEINGKLTRASLAAFLERRLQ
jgi:hypothetical protein